MDLKYYTQMMHEELEFCFEEMKKSSSWGLYSYYEGRAKGIMIMGSRLGVMSSEEYKEHSDKIQASTNEFINKG